jgi:hypothetical protein
MHVLLFKVVVLAVVPVLLVQLLAAVVEAVVLLE